VVAVGVSDDAHYEHPIYILEEEEKATKVGFY
jgi:hypothetical protein